MSLGGRLGSAFVLFIPLQTEGELMRRREGEHCTSQLGHQSNVDVYVAVVLAGCMTDTFFSLSLPHSLTLSFALSPAGRSRLSRALGGPRNPGMPGDQRTEGEHSPDGKTDHSTTNTASVTIQLHYIYTTTTTPRLEDFYS